MFQAKVDYNISFISRSVSWNRDVSTEKLSFTMRREFDKHKEEEELIKQLKSVSFNLSRAFI